MSSSETLDELLADEIAKRYADPLGYVMFCFPWTEEASIQLVKMPQPWADRYQSEWGPDGWACEFLDELGGQIRDRGFNGVDPVDPIRFATVSGHEIGKSTLVAWLIKFIMDTRPMSQGTVSAVTDEQLRSRTWAELGKWHYMSLTSHWFKFSAGRGSMILQHANPAWAGAWKCVAKTSREERSESMQGQHAPTATSFFIFDEASGIGAKPFEVREGALSSGEPMVFDFGNGTRNSGTFYEECAGKLKSRYIVRSIDSRTVSITNKRKIQADVDTYGEDSDFVRVRWRGLFPSIGSTQFIGVPEVLDAMARELTKQDWEPRVLSCDPARFGDDSTVIGNRKGRDVCRSFPILEYKGLDTIQIADMVIAEFRKFEELGDRPEAIFVDETGLGGGVVDQLRHARYPVVGVNFGGKPTDATHYRFKGDEMWGRFKKALPEMALASREMQHSDRILADLTQREYGLTAAGGRINMESKRDMKARGLPSPDFGDAVVLLYAQELGKADPNLPQNNQVRKRADHDPIQRFLEEERN